MNKVTGIKFFFLSPILLLLFSCGTKKGETGNAAADSAKTEKAVTPLDQLTEKIKAEPNNPELYHSRAKFELAEKKFTPAVNDVNKAISLDSTKAPYYITLANIYFATFNIPKSDEAFHKAIAVDSKNVEAYLKLAELYLYLKKYKDAIENTNEVLKIDPHKAKAYFIKGYVYAYAHDTALSIASFQACVEEEPENYDAFLQLGILYKEQSKPLAEQYYNRALKLRPNSTEALYDRGLYYQDRSELDKATDDYNSILKIDPNYKDAYYNLGFIEVNWRKNYQKAIEYFSQAIEKDKDYVEAIYNRGYCYEMSGNKQKAREDYLLALKLDATYDLPKKGMKRIGG